MSLFTLRCMRRRKKRENFESLRSLSYSMQDISLQPPAADSLQSLSINSLQPIASHSLQSLTANSLQPPASLSLQSLAINSFQPPASHSLQSLSANSLLPPASHSLQSLSINCRQSPDGQSLQTPVVNSLLVGRGSLSPTFARTGTTSLSRGGLEQASGTGTADTRMPPGTPEVRPFTGAPSIRLPEDPVFSTGTPGHSSVSYAPVFPAGTPEANPECEIGTATPSAVGRRNKSSDVWSSTTDGKTNDEPDDQHGPPARSQTHQTSCSDGVLTIAIGQDDNGGGGSDEEATRTSKGGAGFVVHTDSFFGRELSRLKIALSNHRDVVRPRNVKKRSRKL
jgi:hypothetical protein